VWVEEWVEDLIQSLLEDSVTDTGFVDSSSFRVTDYELLVFSVLISTIGKLLLQSEDIFFEVQFEFRYIYFLPLVTPEFSPSQE
jgi:hypothetical protein